MLVWFFLFLFPSFIFLPPLLFNICIFIVFFPAHSSSLYLFLIIFSIFLYFISGLLSPSCCFFHLLVSLLSSYTLFQSFFLSFLLSSFFSCFVSPFSTAVFHYPTLRLFPCPRSKCPDGHGPASPTDVRSRTQPRQLVRHSSRFSLHAEYNLFPCSSCLLSSLRNLPLPRNVGHLFIAPWWKYGRSSIASPAGSPWSRQFSESQL